MDPYIQLEITDGVASLTLDRAEKRNALKRDFIEQVNRALDQIKNDPSARVLLLRSTGSIFCAGMDLGEMQQRAEAADKNEQWHQDSVVFGEMLTQIYSLPIPTVAVVQGPALAGGMGLVVACDIVIATDTVFFSLPEPMRGITAAMVSPLLIHRIGNGPAAYMLLSGCRIDAKDAYRFGLIHRLVAANELESQIKLLTQSILTGSPRALAITKKHLDDCAVANLSQQIEASIAVSAEARETADAREGLTAFLEKRKPNWIKE